MIYYLIRLECTLNLIVIILFQKYKLEQYHKQKAVFLDQYKAIEPRIYVQDDKMGTKIFIPDLKEAPNCDLIEELGDVQAISNNVDNNNDASSEASGQINTAPIRKSQRVVLQCTNKYKLLSQRTKTIRDLKNSDSSANKKKSGPISRKLSETPKSNNE